MVVTSSTVVATISVLSFIIAVPSTRLLCEMSLLVPALEDSVRQLIMRLESAYGTAATTPTDSNVRDLYCISVL